MLDSFWEEERPVAMTAPGIEAPPLGEAPPLVFFQTSGTMGAPKWVGLSRAALLKSAMEVNLHLEVDADSVWGLALPPHHVGGMGVAARAYEAGCELEIFPQRWQEHDFVRWIESRNITHTSLVPTQVHDIVHSGLHAPSCVSVVVVGGGRLSEDDGVVMREMGWPVLPSYGMTEAASQIATQGLECLDLPYACAPMQQLRHWQLRLEEDGCLAIRGPSLFEGILIQEDGRWSYQAREGEWFVTRDRVDLDEVEGVTPLGRADLCVKVLGELVDLQTIERRLVGLSLRRLHLRDLMVLALEDARAGHRLVPVVDAAADRAAVEQTLWLYHTKAPGPERLQDPVFLEGFPRSALDKPLRAECARRVAALHGFPGAPGSSP